LGSRSEFFFCAGRWPAGTLNSIPRSSFALTVARTSRFASGIFLGVIIQNVNRLPHNGVVGHFLLMAILENEDRRLDGLRLTCRCRRLRHYRRRWCCFRLHVIGGRAPVGSSRRLLNNDVQGWVARAYLRLLSRIRIGTADIVVVIAVIAERDEIIRCSIGPTPTSKPATMIEAGSIVKVVSEARGRHRRNAGRWRSQVITVAHRENRRRWNAARLSDRGSNQYCTGEQYDRQERRNPMQ